MRLVVILFFVLSLMNCNSKTANNTDFPAAISDLNGDDFENPLWKAVRALLLIPAFDGGSLEKLGTSIGTPSGLITDPLKSTEASVAQVKGYLSNADSQHCLEVKSPLIDINPGAAVGLSNAIELKNGQPTALALAAKVYWMSYKLKGDADYRNALLTVPITDAAAAHTASSEKVATKSESAGTFGYPLILYAHAGSTGLAYEEIGLALGQLQSGHIVAAPAFPGEPLCRTYNSGPGPKTCTDTHILAPPVGLAKPYGNDTEDLLGLHDCIKTLARNTAGIATLNIETKQQANENISRKIIKISAKAQVDAQALGQQSGSPALLGLADAAGAPVSIMLGLGRGAGVSVLALARAGAINSLLFSTQTDAETVAIQSQLAGAGVSAGLFSCAGIVAPHSSFSAGTNKILFEYWVTKSSGLIGADGVLAADFIPGFASIHQAITAISEDPALAVDQKAVQISEFIKSTEAIMHLPLVNGGLQNFGKVFRAKLLADPASAARTVAAAKGSALILHGTKDKIADFSNTQLLSGIAVQTSIGVAAAGISPGVSWLALGVVPPAASLDASGALIDPNDFGHVGDISFLGGSTAIAPNVPSSPELVTAPFLGKSPADAVGVWLASQCYPAMVADPIP